MGTIIARASSPRTNHASKNVKKIDKRIIAKTWKRFYRISVAVMTRWTFSVGSSPIHLLLTLVLLGDLKQIC